MTPRCPHMVRVGALPLCNIIYVLLMLLASFIFNILFFQVAAAEEQVHVVKQQPLLILLAQNPVQNFTSIVYFILDRN